MRLSLLEERSKDSSPNVLVTFPDGYTDRLVLRKHFFNEKDRMEDESHCNYLGHLAKETDACVAMTGCLGAVHVLLSKFYLDFLITHFTQILSRFFNNSLYPNFIQIFY